MLKNIKTNLSPTKYKISVISYNKMTTKYIEEIKSKSLDRVIVRI